ncbi:MAG: DNA internalization-related competence protein ComEC/Rec2 [Bacilli bacterium]
MIILKSFSFNFYKNFKVVINSGVYNCLLNNYFLIALGMVFNILTYVSLIFIIVLALYIFYVYKKNRLIATLMIFLGFLFLLRIVTLENRDIKISANLEGQVTSLEEKQYYNRLIVKNKKQKVMIYDYDFQDIKIGDIIEVDGYEAVIESNRVWNGFDYSKYLRHNNIDYVIKAENIIVLSNKFHLNIIKDKVFKYFMENYEGESLTFLNALLLGDDSYLTEDFKDTLKVNGILHLFAISGSHIALFILLLNMAFKKIGFNDDTISVCIVIFLIFYLIITSFSPSILRASLVYFAVLINKKLKLKFSSIDLLSIVFIMLILYNPYYIYNTGFVLSFLVSSMIVICSSLFKGGYIRQTLLISLYALVITLPIIININYEINILSPITNVIFVFIVISIILPFSIIVVFFPFLGSVYSLILNGFTSLSFFFSEYLSININIPKMNDFSIILYYVILVVFIYINVKYKKFIFGLMLLFLFVYSNSVYLKKFEINFLDLYYGESTIIIEKGRVIIIDTGDGRNDELSIFLKSIGVKKIDFLILTHNHDDHNGETINLINNFKVKNIILSEFDDSIYAGLDNVIIVKKIDTISVGDIEMIIYPPKINSTNVNDNSLIVKLNYKGFDVLFTGDATKLSENEYNYGKIDVLKVGHHGSNTSTADEFLDKIKPEYAIIMTGRIKQFGFPNKNVINRLNHREIDTYRTDIHYSIKMYIDGDSANFIYLNKP